MNSKDSIRQLEIEREAIKRENDEDKAKRIEYHHQQYVWLNAIRYKAKWTGRKRNWLRKCRMQKLP
jgi:hypothetical protein